MALILQNITQKYDNGTPLYQDFSQVFVRGRIYAVMGKSGSGKTTLLNVIANLVDYTGQNSCTQASYVFQQSMLVDQLTVNANLHLTLKSTCKSRAERQQLIDQFLDTAQILHLKDKLPTQISAGQRRRVDIARAFLHPSAVVLLDEPFTGLDYSIKQELLACLYTFCKSTNRVVIFVTHDVDEALAVADEIKLIEGTPVQMLHAASVTTPYENRDLTDAQMVQIRQRILSNL
ncbi:MAG: ABC transporter ATP-binding protein [Clostridia bacterium]|nr:ABC transporter ATP-binding protein [Clostridia bacterium]